ncbi:putative hydrophobic protein (TIGR00271 family) [Pseudonocardia hierapolitana]|uniref:Putative hydrophobic protein (TIGR00271 family) n=2 Tax=Pseudonocardia hierapolitana TaxID=1128676 RepID=A0A561T1G4_9PSEU|nr:putative hydrophobic protein (TIGR00271 family) [Pseudonocardia hierapolitana]
MRVIAPADRSAAVRDLLVAEPGATHVAVFPGAAVQPAGDVIEADVAREAADDLLGQLCTLGVDRSGGVTLELIDTSLSDAADAAEEAAPGDPQDAVIWDEVVARTGEESRLSISYQAFLTIACLLAAIGAITDSPVTVVGAMVLGPEFGPLAAVAVGLVLRRGDLVRRGAVALGAGFPLAMAVTALGTLLLDATGLLSTAQLADLDQVAFIYEVGPFSLIVALLAGAAGMLSLTSAKSASLVGVFISVTTVPAAAFASVALVEGRYVQAMQSGLQLAVNLVGIVIAAAAVLLLARSRSERGGRKLSAG